VAAPLREAPAALAAPLAVAGGAYFLAGAEDVQPIGRCQVGQKVSMFLAFVVIN
jgi:hypothetical protein